MSLQYGLKEVMNTTIFDFTTGAQLFYVDYMLDSAIISKAQRLDIRGGQGNYKLLSFDHSKDMNFTAKIPLVDLNTLAMLTSKPLTIGATNVPIREVLVSATQTITLSQTPVTGTLKIYLVSGRDVGVEQTVGDPATTVNTYSISGKTVTLNATTAPDGTTFVCTYSYSAPATTATTTFTADKFANYVRIVGQTLMTDEVTGAIIPAVFDIKKAKAKNDFTLTMSSTKATEIDLDFDMYSIFDGNNQVFCTFNALK